MTGHAYGKKLHVRFETGKYKCPHCLKEYTDGHRREKQIFRNKKGYARRDCEGLFACGRRFGLAICMVDGIKGFKL